MAAAKNFPSHVSSPAASILAPPPTHLPPPSYEESSSARLPPAYVDPNPPPIPSRDVNHTTAAFTQELPQEQPLSPWVKRNLSTARFTVFFMILVAISHLIFACIVNKDLHNDEFDEKCARYYILSADDPPEGERWTVPAPGRYHADCRRLYHWSQLLTAAASTTVLRALLQALIPVHRSPGLACPRNRIAKSLRSPAGVYALRTISSLALFALYFASGLVLCTNRFITGPMSRDSLRPVYLGSVGLIWFSVLVTGHQAVTTGIASWCMRGYKDPNERSYTPSI
ncbi:unnamed protein product [Clonostachys rosea]|uniref:Uncharacterized protein n=1 Tax=Bionectria ochroleuca TaxID=29856 RepID=A0ABY6TYG7_BIOOC|nr:unnamed protein product [Clonostachys rosea]